MDSKPMSDAQRSWCLPAGRAQRLSIGPGVRCLHLLEGRLWLTRDATRDAPSADIWLQAGDELTLASGSEWVVEGWPQARFDLLVPPQACVRPGFLLALCRISAWAWRRVANRFAAPSPLWPA